MSVKKKSFKFLQVISLLGDLSYSMQITTKNIENLATSTKKNTPVAVKHIKELKNLDARVQKMLKNAKSETKTVKEWSPTTSDKRTQAYLKKIKKVEKEWGGLEKKIELAYSFRQPSNADNFRKKYSQKTDLKPAVISRKSADVLKKDTMNKKDILKKYTINAKDITEAKRKKKKIDKPAPALKPKSAGKKTAVKKKFNTNAKGITTPSAFQQNAKSISKTKQKPPSTPKPPSKPKSPSKPKGPRL